MKAIVFLAALLVVAGCSSGPVMRNPVTGVSVTCGPYFRGGIHTFTAAERERQCVQDFKEQGFVRVSS